jgi:hypothetical protein
MHFFSQVSHITLMPLRTRNMVHHILKGRPLQTRTNIRAEEVEGEDNIIFPRRIVHLLKIQVAPCPMHMDSTHTCPPILSNWSKMYNVSMSMRIQSSITYVAWTRQTWKEYKAQLLATQGIELLFTMEHHMTHYTWMMPH